MSFPPLPDGDNAVFTLVILAMLVGTIVPAVGPQAGCLVLGLVLGYVASSAVAYVRKRTT